MGFKKFGTGQILTAEGEPQSEEWSDEDENSLGQEDQD